MAVINGLFWLVYCLLFACLAGRQVAYCFKKRKATVNYTPWLLLLSILPVVSIFRQGTYESGDLSLHATRLMAFWESISQGEIIPRWAGSLNAGYGYPLFQFIYPLPYYLASFWHWFGFGFINSIKITIALAYTFSGLAFFYLVKKHVSNLAAFTGAALYLFAPYHLVDLHFRVAFGEVIAFVFLPLTMLCGSNYIDSVFPSFAKSFGGAQHRNDKGKETRLWLVLSGLSFAGLTMSHQAIALISPAIILPYWWTTIYIDSRLRGNDKGKLKLIVSTCKLPLLGLVLSAFYWVPVLLESNFVLAKSFALGVEFEKVWEYLYSPWRLGLLFQGPNGELAFLIGYVQIALVVITGWKLFKQNAIRQKPFISLFGLLFVVFCFLLLPSSKFIWDGVSILKNFHYTYRLLLPIALITAILGAFVAETFIQRRKLIYLLIFLTVSSTILNWGNRRNIPEINDNYLRIDLPFATIRGEGLDAGATKWSDINNLWQKEPTKTFIETNGHIGDYRIITNLNRKKIIVVTVDQPTLIKVNQLYFPGWWVTVNGESKPILFEQKEHYGKIAFHLPTGESEVRLEFRDTLVRKTAGIISLTGIGFGILGYLGGLGRLGKFGGFRG